MSIISMLELTHVPLDMPLHVKSPLRVSAKLDLVCKSCPLLIGNKEFFVDLIVLANNTFDVILDDDWLQLNHVVIYCYEMKVSFHVPQQPIFHYKCIKNDVAMRVGFLALLESLERRFMIPEVSKVCEDANVFQDIPGLPPRKVMEFGIDVIPGTSPISKAPYKMAPTKLNELKILIEKLVKQGLGCTCFVCQEKG
ncbi:hypothetical protein CerSpe_008910 [Prunus speciosa]